MSEKFLNTDRVSELWTNTKEYIAKQSNSLLLNSISRELVIEYDMWEETPGFDVDDPDYFEVSITCSGVVADEKAQLIVVDIPDNEFGIRITGQSLNTLVFRADSQPTDSYIINVIIINISEPAASSIKTWVPMMKSNSTPVPLRSSVKNSSVSSINSYIFWTNSYGSTPIYVNKDVNPEYRIIYSEQKPMIIYGIGIVDTPSTVTTFRSFDLEGSNDYSTWILLDTFVNTDITNRLYSLRLKKPAMYKYYRIGNFWAFDPEMTSREVNYCYLYVRSDFKVEDLLN